MTIEHFAIVPNSTNYPCTLEVLHTLVSNPEDGKRDHRFHYGIRSNNSVALLTAKPLASVRVVSFLVISTTDDVHPSSTRNPNRKMEFDSSCQLTASLCFFNPFGLRLSLKQKHGGGVIMQSIWLTNTWSKKEVLFIWIDFSQCWSGWNI